MGITFIGELDPGKYNTDVRKRKACAMLGGAFLKQAGHLALDEPKLMFSRDGHMITLQCVVKDPAPEFALEIKAYLAHVIQVINEIDPSMLP